MYCAQTVYHIHRKGKVTLGKLQLCATACALYKGSSGFNFKTKTKERKGGGKETNHIAAIKLPTCCLCGLALLKNSSNMNIEVNTTILNPHFATDCWNKEQEWEASKNYGSKQSHRQSQWCTPESQDIGSRGRKTRRVLVQEWFYLCIFYNMGSLCVCMPTIRWHETGIRCHVCAEN